MSKVSVISSNKEMASVNDEQPQFANVDYTMKNDQDLSTYHK